MPFTPSAKGSKWVIGEDKEKIKQQQFRDSVLSSVTPPQRTGPVDAYGNNPMYHPQVGPGQRQMEQDYQAAQRRGQTFGTIGSIAASLLFPGGGLLAPVIGGMLGNIAGQAIGNRGTGIDMRNVIGRGLTGGVGGVIGGGLAGAPTGTIAGQILAGNTYQGLVNPDRMRYTPYYEYGRY